MKDKDELLDEAAEAGDYLLGRMILFPQESISRLRKLRGHHFVHGRQQMLFIELMEMYRTKAVIDLVTVKNKCLEAGMDRCFVGGEKEMTLYLMELEEDQPSPFKLIEYRNILLENKGGDAQ